MTKLEFDDEFSRLMEEFNVSPGAVERRARILAALDLKTGTQVLDVGSGPGHQAYEIAQVIGSDGRIEGVDSAEGSVETGRRRCAGLQNASFTLGDAYNLAYDDGTFDTAMSSQVFEYLDDVPKALGEMFRVLKPGGRVLIHGTENPRGSRAFARDVARRVTGREPLSRGPRPQRANYSVGRFGGHTTPIDGRGIAR